MLENVKSYIVYSFKTKNILFHVTNVANTSTSFHFYSIYFFCDHLKCLAKSIYHTNTLFKSIKLSIPFDDSREQNKITKNCIYLPFFLSLSLEKLFKFTEAISNVDSKNSHTKTVDC